MADWLTRKTAADEVNGREVVLAALSHVSKPGNVRPVLCKYSVGVVVNFDLPDNAHSCSFESKF